MEFYDARHSVHFIYAFLHGVGIPHQRVFQRYDVRSGLRGRLVRIRLLAGHLDRTLPFLP